MTTVRPVVRGRRSSGWSKLQKGLFGAFLVLMGCIGFTISRAGLQSLSGSSSASMAGSGPTATAAATATSATDIPIESARPELSTWVAQLASVPVGDDQQLLDQYRLAQAAAGPVKVVRSDELPVWRPNFLVIYHVGDYPTGNDVVRFCNSIHRSVPQDCGGRFVSDNPADLFRYCATLQDVAKCTRDRPENS